MTKIYRNYLKVQVFLLLLLHQNLFAQVNFTANEQVFPYEKGFHPSANIGEYTSFSPNELAELAAGSPEINVPGIGVKSLRPGLFESFLGVAGYDASVATFEFYKELGMGEHTVIVGFPSDQYKDPTQHCPGIPSEMFANLYEPIWDDGENGTPVNEENYYASYLWQTVSQYKDYVRFWEIWNEPGFDFTGGLGFLPPGAEGSWWDNDPDPCDYKLRAPIQEYVRTLRISWEVIKTVDPEAYVVVSGTGFPSFLDAILRNTDNPNGGAVTPEYPLGGGAYFDVMGYHSYPHFDGSLQEWSDELNDWIYSRHSDGAAEGVLRTKEIYQELLADYGYDGITYPEKEWVVTEVNLPRKEFGEFIGSAEAQRNFIIKGMVACMMNDIQQFHIFKLAEDTYFDGAYDEFDLMGLYKRLDYNDLYFQEMNDEGIAHKTASEILYGKSFDTERTAAMQLSDQLGGGAFRDEHGNHTYVLWAKTETDRSESAQASFSFPNQMNVGELLRCEWDAGKTHATSVISSLEIPLTGAPVFLSERIFSLHEYAACAPFSPQFAILADDIVDFTWLIESENESQSFSNEVPSIQLNEPGEYLVHLTASTSGGQMLTQGQRLFINAVPEPAFNMETHGPIIYFQNETTNGFNEFHWDFGDDQSSIDPVPTHVYLESGTYEVTMTVSNECGSLSTSQAVEVVSPSTSMLEETANDTVPTFKGDFRPGTSWDFVPGWTDEQIANLIPGNPLEGVTGIGGKAIRTYIGESFFLANGYDIKTDLFQHYENIDLRDNTFLLAFPSEQNRDEFFYCPEQQSAIFRDLYLDIWDNGENGTPVNDENPFALYIWNVVTHYGDQVRFWEIYNSPDFDLTGDRAWLPPGEPGNWWENNPDPCEYELRAPIFYYVRSLRIAYEIIKSIDPEDYVTISGIAFPSFLDAVCRNTDNPVDGSTSEPYPLKGGAYFDAVGFKSYPHFDGSTIYFDTNTGTFAFERHSDAAVSGISRVQQMFIDVLKNYGYDGIDYPEKKWVISEANLPRKAFFDYLGSGEAQRNWTIKAWVEAVKNDILQLNFFRLAESRSLEEAADPFEVMGFYQKMEGVIPYSQTRNTQGVALKTCSDLLFGTDYNQQRTEALMLPEHIDGAAFSDAAGNFVYVLWAKTETDMSEAATTTYSFPASLEISQLEKRTWDYSQSQQMETISANEIQLTGAPVFLLETAEVLVPPVAFFTSTTNEICVSETVSFTSISTGTPNNFTWNFPGGAPDSHFGATPPAVLYETPGTYPVSLTVDNQAGEHTAIFTDFITVEALPTAEFEVMINGAEVTFINLSDNATTYEWCYGDGFCNSAENPSYVYFSNGEYEVTLTSINGCGEDIFSQTINIGAAPTAAFQMEHLGNCESPEIQFLDLSFSNPESWLWQVPGGEPNTTEERYPIISFPAGGWYEVTLIAGNGIGADTLTESIYVEGNINLETAVSLCSGDEYNGVAIFSDTVFTTVIPTQSLGCDSTVMASVEITELIETFDAAERCEGESFHGIAVFQDTVFVETFSLAEGCDSVSTTEVAVFPNEETFLTQVIVSGEFFMAGNEVFDETGMYDIFLMTTNGCDSLVHLDLTVVTSIDEIADQNISIDAFPNPFEQEINLLIELPESQTVSLDIFDVNGRLVSSIFKDKLLPAGQHQMIWKKEWLGSGMYFVRLQTMGTVRTLRILGM